MNRSPPNFGIAGRLANDNLLKGFDSVRGRILSFSYLQAVAVNTMLALSRSL